MQNDVVFRELSIQDAQQAQRIHSQFLSQNQIPFLLCQYKQGQNFQLYLQRVQAYKFKETVPQDRVVSTFLLALVQGKIAGRLSVRHQLNQFLATIGGHIGFAVVHKFRGRGLGKILLREGIQFCRRLRIKTIYLTCLVDNKASRAVIQKCGGKLVRTLENPYKKNQFYEAFHVQID